MKKFCSKCGSQLDLSKRVCDNCGAFNPFFISGFGSPERSAPSGEENPLKAGTEKLNEEKEAEWRKNLQEEVRRNREKLIKEDMERERLERERIELNLKQEIARVKEDSEQNQQKAIGLVNEVREELHIIEEENKRLKREVEALAKVRVQPKVEPVPTPPAQELKELHESGKKRSKVTVIMIIVFVVGLAGGTIGYFVYTNQSNPEPAKKPATSQVQSEVGQPNASPTQSPASNANDTASTTSAPDTATKTAIPPVDTAPQKKLLAVVATSHPAAESKAVTPPATPSTAHDVNNGSFTLTLAKVRSDIIGKKISGCGITIRKADEIKSVDNLALVEKLSDGTFKYKMTAKISQAADNFTAVPYLYYNSYGVLIRIDGTNCE